MPFSLKPPARPVVPAMLRVLRFKRWIGVFVGLLLFVVIHPHLEADEPLPVPNDLTLAWNPSASPEINGYNVYYGTTSGDYPKVISVDTVTTATVPGLSSGLTYYFAVTAVDVEGVESGFSNEISYRAPLPGAQLQILGMAGGQFTLTVTGTVGQTYDLEATKDFTTWTVIGTGTVDANGSLSFTDPTAGNFQQRFYRTRETQP